MGKAWLYAASSTQAFPPADDDVVEGDVEGLVRERGVGGGVGGGRRRG